MNSAKSHSASPQLTSPLPTTPVATPASVTTVSTADESTVLAERYCFSLQQSADLSQVGVVPFSPIQPFLTILPFKVLLFIVTS